MAGGWIKLHRELLEKSIWQCSTTEQKSILITILLLANHEEKDWIWQGQRYSCHPGQFITSLEQLAKKSGTSIRNVRTALKNFEQIYEFLTSKATNKNTLITVVNWELYQSENIKGDKQTDKQVTSNRQASDKQVTTNKNDKNIKNDKKDKNIYIPLTFIDEVIDKVKITEEQYSNLINKFGETLVHKNIIALDNYITNGKGKNYKDHYRALNTWCSKDKPSTEIKEHKNKPGNFDNFEQREYDYEDLEKKLLGWD